MKEYRIMMKGKDGKIHMAPDFDGKWVTATYREKEKAEARIERLYMKREEVVKSPYTDDYVKENEWYKEKPMLIIQSREITEWKEE